MTFTKLSNVHSEFNSVDNLGRHLAAKFVAKFPSLSNLRQDSQGYWIADQDDLEPYRITHDTYLQAWLEGDIQE